MKNLLYKNSLKKNGIQFTIQEQFEKLEKIKNNEHFLGILGFKI